MTLPTTSKRRTLSSINDNTTHCFESAWMKRYFSLSFPDARCFSLDELLKLRPQAIESSPEERLELVGQWAPEDSPLVLKTLEDLRASLVLGHEDVDYCFSLLPEVPKNQALQKVFHQYLDSPLRQDKTQEVWDLVEALKSFQWSPPVSGNWIFIAADPPGHLFKELALGFGASPEVEESQYLFPWEWEPQPKQRGIQLSAEPAICLDRIAERVRHLIRQSLRPHEIQIMLACEPHWWNYLRYRLAHLKIGFQQWPDKETIGEDSKDSKVALVPFPSIPVGSQVLGFTDDSFWLFPRTPSLLTDIEMETLFEAGFPLPKASEARQRRSKALDHLFANQRNLWFHAGHWEALGPKKLKLAQALAPTPETKSSQSVLLKPRPLSATQLETYANCPAKYLFQNRLKLSPPGWDRAYPLILGKAVHLALELHWKEKAETPELNDLLERFDLVMNEVEPELPKDHSIYALLSVQYESLMANAAKCESQLQDLGPSTPFAFEKDFSVELSGITFRGKIDRIDRREDGSLWIIDYKTGTVGFSPNQITTGKHFQAWLYLMAAEQLWKEPCAGVLFYDLKEGTVKRGLAHADWMGEQKKLLVRGHCVPQPKWEALKEMGLEHSQSIYHQISAGNFEPTPGAHCQVCDFAILCREGLGYQ